MTTQPTNEVLRHLHRTVLLHDGAGLPDGPLLARFVEGGDEAAFAALVRRHGPMVWGVCRRLLPEHDAEDAFQATFLALFRKAASIRPREKVAGWLHGAARRAALLARRTAARRRSRERPAAHLPEPEAPQRETWDDLRPLLDEELSRLPEAYRSVFVLCDLEGRTRAEAARHLGCPEGTVAGRLARARAMLGRRLARRGVGLAAIALPAVLARNAASAGVPPALVSFVIEAVRRNASGGAGGLAAVHAGGLGAMARMKIVVASLLVLGAVAMVAAVVASGQTGPWSGGPDGPAGRADAPPKDAGGERKDPLRVTITPEKEHVRVKEAFAVRLRVVNATASVQSFEVMNCSWDEHWKSGNERVTWEGWDCTKNFPVTVELQPGDAYEKTLQMILRAGEPKQEVPLKMGFTPLGSKRTYWSNEVMLHVNTADAREKDRAALQGTWAAVAVERDGKAVPDEEVKALDLQLIVENDTFLLMPQASKGPEHFPYGTFRLDPEATPKAIDLLIDQPFRPAVKATTVLGIYALDGDRLKLLQGRPGQGRPAAFQTAPLSGVEIITFERRRR